MFSHAKPPAPSPHTSPAAAPEGKFAQISFLTAIIKHFLQNKIPEKKRTKTKSPEHICGERRTPAAAPSRTREAATLAARGAGALQQVPARQRGTAGRRLAGATGQPATVPRPGTGLFAETAQAQQSWHLRQHRGGILLQQRCL